MNRAKTRIAGLGVVVLVALMLPATALATDDGRVDDFLNAGFDTSLSPEEEVTTTPIESDASGSAGFRTDGSSVEFRLDWRRLTTPTLFGHIHCAPAGVNGPVGVTLFMGANDTTDQVAGSFSGPDPANSCGWETLADVLAAMVSGNTYVNVHTTQYPAGELRGQI